MPLMTHAEYMAAEFDGVELTNPGRGEYSLDYALGRICQEAVEFEEFREDNVELEAELARHAVLIQARQRMVSPFARLAGKIGDKIVKSLEAVGAPYAAAFGGSDSAPPANNLGFPF